MSEQKRRASLPESALNALMLYSSEAEKAVLGSMLARPDAVIDIVTEKLNRSDFFVPSHQELFEAIKDLHNSMQAVDITTLHQYLVDRKMAEAVGSPGILAELATGLSTHLNVESYIKIVKDKSLLRHLQHACAGIVQNISDSPENAEAICDTAEADIMAVRDHSIAAGKEQPFAKSLESAVADVFAWSESTRQVVGIPSGFHKLDQLTTGWQKGDMIVLAARPGIGKTSLALAFARNVLKERWHEPSQQFIEPGIPTGIFSLEMPTLQLNLKLLAMQSRVSLQRIRKGQIDEHDKTQITQAKDTMKTWPLQLIDSDHLTLNALRAKARRLKRQHEIEFLVIDYLQLLHSDSAQAKDNRQNEVAELSRGIKSLAKELEIPILVLAQLNRKSEEAKTEPALHNLRESGAIEQDADVVLLLHRLPDQPTDAKMINYTLNIAKQRNGPLDRCEMVFNADLTRFEDPLRFEPNSPPPGPDSFHQR